MIVCQNCGTRNEDGESFCRSCGTYLEWDGERVAAPSRPATEQTGPDADPASAPPASAPPAAVHPGEAVAKPPPRPATDNAPALAPGDLVCRRCGAGNPATRTFCRRCGASLAEAPRVAASRLPWWRRILRRAPDPGLVAGSRHERKVRRSHGGLVALLIVAAVLAGAGWFGRPYLAAGYNAVLDRVRGPAQVNPTQATASSAQPGQEAAFATDGAANRYWAPDATGSARGQFLRARFPQPFRLVYVAVFSGISDRPPEFLTQGRPHELRLTLQRTGGRTDVRTLALRDEPGAQTFHLALDGVVGARITILSAYGDTPGKQVAVGEVKFFTRA